MDVKFSPFEYRYNDGGKNIAANKSSYMNESRRKYHRVVFLRYYEWKLRHHFKASDFVRQRKKTQPEHLIT